jgi:hypothetical protein
MPRKQHFVYNGSVYQDIKDSDGTIVYSANQITADKGINLFIAFIQLKRSSG